MMQETENEGKGTPPAPADPQSHPLQQVSLVQGNENDDDPDAIFLKAVAEIDTQPLPKRRRTATRTIADILEIAFLVSVLLCGLLGSAYLAITYPHTLVVLFTQARPASITTMLDVATRTLAPVTLTRSFTVPTTGKGHQDAQVAYGSLTFYNGQLQSVNVPSGSVFTGRDGEQIVTTQDARIPDLAQQIQGDTPAKARTFLLTTSVISYASVPETLPPAMYINFLVLVG